MARCSCRRRLHAAMITTIRGSGSRSLWKRFDGSDRIFVPPADECGRAYGYQVVKRTQNDGIEKPDAASLFDEHTGTVNKETTVAVTGLETGCSYVLYAAVKAETLYSEVAELAFTTGVNSNEIIEVSDIGSDRFTFSIRCEGPYFFAAIPTATLNTYTIEEYLTEAGCIGRGEAEYDRVDGGNSPPKTGLSP